MPEFERDAYDLQDFHNDQLRHYGLRKAVDVAPQASITRPSVSGRSGATSMPIPRPQRKPVAVKNATNNTRGGTRSPTQEPKGLLPNQRLIYVDADGKFDPSSIRRPDGTPVRSPSVAESRCSLSSTPRLQRTDSVDSKSSWRSRRDSAEQAIRRFSLSLKEKTDIVGMTPDQRMSYLRIKDKIAQQAAVESPGGRKGSVSKGEQIALGISKAMDPLKVRGGRRLSDESLMSFGMTDAAPVDVMLACERCFRPTREYLVEGLCLPCHGETKDRRARGKDDASNFVTAWQSPQGRNTLAASPEHGYVKLPSSKKMVRIRQTLYADPGNPFGDEMTEAQGKGRVRDETGGKVKVAMLPRTDIRRGESSDDESDGFGASEEYDAPRRQWGEDEADPEKDVRDTKFYAFYQDVMRDYQGRE